MKLLFFLGLLYQSLGKKTIFRTSALFSLITCTTQPAISAIDLADINGLYDSFQDQYKILSPAIALLNLKSGVLAGVRFGGNYGPNNEKFLCHRQITHPDGIAPSSDRDCPQDNTTAVIQHVFPSPAGGQLAMSNADSDFFKHITIEQIGDLLVQYTEFKNNPRFTEKLEAKFRSIKGKLPGSLGSQIAIAWKHISPDNTLNTLMKKYAELFAGASQEATKYPNGLIESVLLTLAMEKASNINDLKPLLDKLEKYQQPIGTSKKFSENSHKVFKEKYLQNNKIDELGFADLIKQPELLIFSTLARDKYDELFPSPLGPGVAIFETVTGSHADCGEAALLSFLNLTSADFERGRQFNSSFLKNSFPAISNQVINFYEISQPTFDDINKSENRSIWAKVVSRLNTEPEGPKIIYTLGGETCGLQGTGISNVLAVFERLFNDPKITELRTSIPDINEKNEKILNYIFTKFYRPNFKLDWKNKSGDKKLTSEFEDIIISINGAEKYDWQFRFRHFEFLPIGGKPVDLDWRKNNPKILRKFGALNSQLQQALIPFYIAEKYSIQNLKDAVHETAHLSPFVLYGSLASKNITIDNLQPLNMSAELGGESVKIVARKWLESLTHESVNQPKIVATVYNMQKNVPNWNDFFTASNFPKTYPLVENGLRDVNNKFDEIANYWEYPFSENLLMDTIKRQNADDLISFKLEIKKGGGDFASVTRWTNLSQPMAKFGHLKTIELLNQKVPKIFQHPIEAKDSGEGTALHFAADGGNPEVVEFIIENFPHLRSDLKVLKDEKGNTPLHRAIYADKKVVEIITLFINKLPLLLKDRSLAKTFDGRNFIHMAAEMENLEAIRLFFKNAPEFFTEADLAKNNNGNTPLHVAAIRRIDALKLLLELAPNLAQDIALVRNKEGNSPLHLAGEYSQPPLIKLLLEKAPQLARDKRFIKNNDDLTFLPTPGWVSVDVFTLLAAAAPRFVLQEYKEKFIDHHLYQKVKSIVEGELSKTDRPADSF